MKGTVEDIKQIDTVAGLLESTTLSEELKADIQQMRENIDHSVINGYVTVIKNPGKPNEEVLCRDIHNLLVDDGRDEIHQISYTEGSATAGGGFNYRATGNGRQKMYYW